MSAIASFGTFIQVYDVNDANPTTIAEVRDINGLSLKADQKETTSHSSGQPWKTRIPTLLDIGDVKFGCNFLPTDPTHSAAAGLRKFFTNREKRKYRILYNSDAGGVADAFYAYVTGLDHKHEVAGVYDFSVTLSGTGQPTLG